MERKSIIGVMGGDCSVGVAAGDARLVGAVLMRSERILLTGGKCTDGTGVKDAAMKGAKDEQSGKKARARLIGILPDGPRDWDEAIDHCLFLSTNLSHMQRDAINGVTPDALIFFAGSSGTLCELTFALAAQKPILFWRATQTLNQKYETHVKDGEVDAYLASALGACKTELGPVSGVQSETTVSSLLVMLACELAKAKDFSGNIGDLVEESTRLAGNPSGVSGFPGFRDDPNSKPRFEEIVRRISS